VLDVEFPQLLQDMIATSPTAPDRWSSSSSPPIPNFLQAWAPRLATPSRRFRCVDVRDASENTISGPATLFTSSHPSPARAGFHPGGGTWIPAPFFRGNPLRCPWCSTTALTPFGVRFPEQTRASWMPFETRCLSVPPARPRLSAPLAKLVEIPGQTEIRRETLQRDVAVTARFGRHDLRRRHGQSAAGIAEAKCAAEHRIPIRRPV